MSPGFALEQLKKTIGSVHADGNDSLLYRSILCMLGVAKEVL